MPTRNILTLPYVVTQKTDDDKILEVEDDHTAQQGQVLVSLGAMLDEHQPGQG